MELEVDRLHVGDNLDLLRRYGRAESVDLVYLDPPFKKNRAYHLIFKDESGRTSDAQQLAFDDSWHWGPTAEAHYRSLVVPSEGTPSPGKLSVTVASLVDAIGRTELTAYLVEMAVRLVELHRVLKPTGSLYLHCDPTASHYLKVILDGVFGPRNFRNEIIWKRTSSHSDARRYGRVHDSILFYTKTDRYTWNQSYLPLSQKTIEGWYNNVEADTGRRFSRVDLTAAGLRGGASGKPWRGIDPAAKGNHWRMPRFLSELVARKTTQQALDALDAAGRIFWPEDPEGVPRLKRYIEEATGIPLLDVITDISPLGNKTRERLGYPTQKPLALLERVIGASSNPGDVVLDPFCGCGTAVEAAIQAKRCWIGIDVSDQAHRVINDRFKKVYGHEVPTGIIAPRDLATARKLATRLPSGRREFEEWAINLVGGRPNPGKDRGVDGLIPFVGRRGRVQRALISVKSGKVKPGDMRDLKGAVTRERAAVGVLVTLAEPSEEMKLEATTAGEYEQGFPKIQIVTVAQALAGIRPALPQYRPQELFAEIPEPEVGETVADRIADLEDRIAEARKTRRQREQKRLERIRDSVRQVLESELEEEAASGLAATVSRKLSRAK